MHYLFITAALLGSLVTNAFAAPAYGHRCIDACPTIFEKCFRQMSVNPVVCWENREKCTEYCSEHPCLHPPTNEDGTLVVIPEDKTIGTRGAHACVDTCDAILAACLATENSPRHNPDFCNAQDRFCHLYCELFPERNLKTINAGTEIILPEPIVARQADSCQDAYECCTEDPSNIGNGLGRCKHELRICLSKCPKTTRETEAHDHVCADACPEILGKCNASPPVGASPAFCQNQNINCEAFCEEFKLHHPKTVDNGTVIIFPPTFTPPIPMEASDVVSTITVTAGAGPTAAPEKRQSQG